jgi:hypothetical protein
MLDWLGLLHCQYRLKNSHSASRKVGHPGRLRSAPEMPISEAPLALVRSELRNGPQRSRARWFCAAKRTLDGEDRCGMHRFGQGELIGSRLPQGAEIVRPSFDL